MRARLAAFLAVALAVACFAPSFPALAQEAGEEEELGRADTPRITALREELAAARRRAEAGVPAPAGGGQGRRQGGQAGGPAPEVGIAAARLGSALMQQGRYREAEPLFQEQIALFRERFGEQDRRTANGLHNLGQLYRNWDRCLEAEPLLEQALAIRRRTLQPGDIAIGWSLKAIGECRNQRLRFTEAEAAVSEAASIIERAEGAKSLSYADALATLGEIQARTARFREAEASLRRVGEIREAAKGPDWPRTLQARRLQALYLARLSRFAEADALARDVLARSEAKWPEKPIVAAANNVVGVVLQAQARYVEAEPYYRKALAILEASAGPESLQVGGTLQNLGENLFRRRRAAEALPLFERERAISEKAGGPDHPQTANAYMWIGSAERQLGRLERAEAATGRAVAIREKIYGPDHRFTAQGRADLAIVMIARNQGAAAEAVLTRSLAAIAAADGADSPSLARPLYNLGRAQRQQRKNDEAEATLRRGLDIMRRSWDPDDELVAWTWQQLAAAQFERGRRDEALASIRNASAVFRARAERLRARPGAGGEPDSEEAAARETYYFHLHYALTARQDVVAKGDAAAAARLADEAFAALQFARASGTEAAVARMAARFASGDDALARAVRAREELADRRKRADARQLAAIGEAGRDRSTESALHAELAELDARLAEADARIATDFPDYAGLVAIQVQTIAEVQQQLRPGEVVVAWLISRLWTNIFAIAPDRVAIERVEFGQAAVAEEIAALRRGLDPSFIKQEGTLPPFDAARSFALYERLLKPVETTLAGAKLVYVVPDRALQSLPVAVLLTAPPARPVRELADYASLPWLAQRHATAVLPSISALRSLRRFARASAAPEAFLGVGDPVLQGPRGATRGLVASSLFAGALADVGAIRRLPPLPDTAAELRAIAKSLQTPEDRVWLRQRASEAAVRKADLTRYRVLSFATHGLMAGEYADVGEPALVLTPPAKASAEDDGLLTASEIARLKLDADWVLLSACNTAAPDGTPGAEGLSGLARAFFYAGSRSLLVSHWSVASDAAVKLTTGIFAAAQKEPGIGRAEAHRRSMMALMTDRAQPYNAHPMVWAPFVVVGEGAAPAR